MIWFLILMSKDGYEHTDTAVKTLNINILFIKVLKSLGKLLKSKKLLQISFLIILFVKIIRSLWQLFGAKKVVASFLPNFLLFFFIFLENDRVSYLL